MIATLAAAAAASLGLVPSGVPLGDPTLSVVVPRGWHLARAKRTSLAYPVERLVLSSAPLGPRGGGIRLSAETRRMGPHDALVLVVEYTRPLRHPFAPKPARFILDGRPRPHECFPDGWLLTWRDHGRNFEADVTLGRHARRGKALAALASVRVDD